MATSNPSLKKICSGLFITAVIIVLYYPSFDHYFWGDDFRSIQLAKDDFSLYRIFVMRFIGADRVHIFYRPITEDIFHKISYALTGLDPLGYRLLSLVVFMANNFFVYTIAQSLTKRNDAALVAAICYASRCAHLLAIYWVNGICDIGSAFFILSSVWFYMRFCKSGNRLYYGFSLLFLVLALMSKETGLILPLLILLVELYAQRQKNNLSPVVSLRRSFPFFIIALLYTARLFLPNIDYASGWYRMKFSLDIVLQNMKFYIVSSFNNRFEIFILSILIIIAFLNAKNRKLASLALLWFLTGILPVIFLEIYHSPRYLSSVSLVGFSLLIACGVKYICDKAFRSSYLVCPLLFAVFLVSAHDKNHSSREYLSFYTRQQQTAYNVISYLQNNFPHVPDKTLMYIKNSSRDLMTALGVDHAIKVHYGKTVATYYEGLSKEPLPEKYSRIYYFRYNQNTNTITLLEGLHEIEVK